MRLSVSERRIDLLVSEDEMKKRRSGWNAPLAAPKRGYAKLYMDHVLQAEHGCDFDFLRKA
jgi:dihydroxy-acid dehydratase